MKKILFLMIIIATLGLFIICPLSIYAADGSTNLQVPIGGEKTVSSFANYIVLVYNFAVGIVGLAAVIMIMIGGYLYMTSHGNAAQAEKGKEFITDAILGLIIVLVSYVILKTINPNLVGNFRANFEELRPTTGPTSPTDPGQRPLITILEERYPTLNWNQLQQFEQIKERLNWLQNNDLVGFGMANGSIRNFLRTSSTQNPINQQIDSELDIIHKIAFGQIQ